MDSRRSSFRPTPLLPGGNSFSKTVTGPWNGLPVSYVAANTLTRVGGPSSWSPDATLPEVTLRTAMAPSRLNITKSFAAKLAGPAAAAISSVGVLACMSHALNGPETLCSALYIDQSGLSTYRGPTGSRLGIQVRCGGWRGCWRSIKRTGCQAGVIHGLRGFHFICFLA